MLGNWHILIFFITIIIQLPFKIETKKVAKKEIINNEVKINESLPVPMINRSFISFKKSEYQGSSKYKIGVCFIGKNFSTMLEKIFCFINSTKNKIKYMFSTCDRKHRYQSLRKMQKAYKLGSVKKLFKEYKMLMVVRNPVDRLISGFMQLCYFRIFLKPDEDYCYKCGKDLSCFIDRLQNELWKVAKNEKIPNQFHDYHFYPQTWQCAYFKHKNEYTYIKYPSKKKNSFYDQLIYYMGKAGVPKNDITYINERMRSTGTKHVTNSKDATKVYKDALFSNTNLIKKVCTIFYHDFIEFGFKFPSQCDQFKNATIS
ncbi:Sulfotransferase family and P-loop containing nucleoside triphosphate hydrolase domain-containing protein [Strongyloides ratti]|uniref:Sulfotransferase family and P-loop containing nucleoside triphosphate hydrolase domain-containing protein n=1 Tax=Strongyloides ratti TaxID=34506 RepID=A0A090N055_STRRB|nr:Sulfotransferase family and P-loop containing nucleoside triphosphate hydrolase domain-containing protein [Strongyloides ratti]CEF70095.1 Sulfotransferase family and P-loop containing nucleoside triphosphate hydrolase domain-containing protein [Strongyloides ratti]